MDATLTMLICIINRLKLVSWIIVSFRKGRIPEIYKNDILIVNPL